MRKMIWILGTLCLASIVFAVTFIFPIDKGTMVISTSEPKFISAGSTILVPINYTYDKNAKQYVLNFYYDINKTRNYMKIPITCFNATAQMHLCTELELQERMATVVASQQSRLYNFSINKLELPKNVTIKFNAVIIETTDKQSPVEAIK